MDMTIEERNRINSQPDARIEAIQTEFNVSYESAKEIISNMDYNTLVCCGMSPEQVEQQVYEEERSRRHR